ncbi:MAG: LysR family transcriptional regulator [Pseudomonadaceae bacterium]|nr:LysR family transcriptional regulator [Pseudomonadaceae bacterium]
MDDLRLLRHFDAVYRLSSFTKAADALGLTHSALTKSIKQLEANWGVRLFDRTTRVVAPTETGRRMFPMTRDLLARADRLREEAVSGAAKLRVVAGPAILDGFTHPGLLAFRQLYPATAVVVETMPPALAIEELIQMRAHVLLYHSASIKSLPYASRIRTWDIVHEPYCVVVRDRHPVLDRTITASMLYEYDWAIAGFDSAYEASLPSHVQQDLARRGFPRYRLLSQSACLQLATETDLLTLVPRSLARRYCDANPVQYFEHPDGIEFSMLAVTLAELGLEPTVQGFIRSLKDALA